VVGFSGLLSLKFDNSIVFIMHLVLSAYLLCSPVPLPASMLLEPRRRFRPAAFHLVLFLFGVLVMGCLATSGRRFSEIPESFPGLVNHSLAGVVS
jgi:hypothetical protein